MNIFTGSLTRYYLQDWSPTSAAENPQDVVTDAATIRKAVLAWQTDLSATLQQHTKLNVTWQERADAPFALYEMSWRAYGALVLWALYHEQNIALPLLADDNFTENGAYQMAQTEEYRSLYPALACECEIWLPAAFAFSFSYPNPNNDELMMGSTAQLLKDLENLNKNTWKADAKTLETWKTPLDAASDTLFEANAQYCFAHLHDLAIFAERQQLPLLLDY
jgi:hypothetical protein